MRLAAEQAEQEGRDQAAADPLISQQSMPQQSMPQQSASQQAAPQQSAGQLQKAPAPGLQSQQAPKVKQSTPRDAASRGMAGAHAHFAASLPAALEDDRPTSGLSALHC